MSNILDCTNLTTNIPCSVLLEISNDTIEDVNAFLRIESNNCKNACEFIKVKISINTTIVEEKLLSQMIHKEIYVSNIEKSSKQSINIEYSLIEHAPDNLQKSSLGIEYFSRLESIEGDKKQVQSAAFTNTIISSQSGTVSGVSQTINESRDINAVKSFNKELIVIFICLIVLFAFFVIKMAHTYKKRFEDSH